MNAPSIPPGPTRSVPQWRGWGAFVAVPLSVAFLPPETPRWVVMWVLAFAIFAACKWLTWRRTPAPQSPLWKHLGYLFAWPGMDAAAFLRGSTPRPPSRRE